jgi:hypothetical protein
MSSPNPEEIRRYLAALYGEAPADAWVEVRYRLGDGMGRFGLLVLMDSSLRA